MHVRILINQSIASMVVLIAFVSSSHGQTAVYNDRYTI